MIDLPSSKDAKTLAKRLRRALAAGGDDPGYAASLELVAQAYGLADWNTLVALAPADTETPRGAGGSVRGAEAQRVVPILRIFDWDAARGFYVDYLGWRVDWDHRFEDHLPRYVQISGADGARLHLSEHHGDGTPGTAVLIEVSGIEALHAALAAKAYAYARPGLEDEDWGRTVTVYDPFGNRLCFLEPKRAAGDAAPPTTPRVSDELPPIRNTVRVGLDPGAAFERFTSFAWWREYGLEDGGRVSIDDGEVVFHNPTREDVSIGRVTAWEPGRRYAQTFTLAQDPDHPTTLEARFVPDGSGTVVELDHGGWNATNAERRGHFGDWPIILGWYAEGT